MNINDFRAKIPLGGARISHFLVQISNPINAVADLDFPFLCQTSSLPGSVINQVELYHFGRAVKFPANRVFDNWDVTVINDEDFRVRNAMEHWMNAINGLETNTRNAPSSATEIIKSTALVRQYSKTNVPIREYKMVGIFPTNITPQDLDWNTDDIQRFSVSFSVDYYFVSGGITGNAGGT